MVSAYSDIDGIVFVLDAKESQDESRLEIACELLASTLETLKEDVPVLLLANKQDLVGSLCPSKLLSGLLPKLLPLLSQRAWRIQGSHAHRYIDSRGQPANPSWSQNQGCVPQGVEWLIKTLRHRRRP